MGTLLQDVGYGLRMLAKNRGFTAVAVITLALGIGANTAIFSVVDALLLRPLPYRDAHRLVEMFEDLPHTSWCAVSYPDYLDWKQQNQVFEKMAAHLAASASLTGVDEPRKVPVGYVAADFFPILQAQPILGRGFLPEEDERSASPVALLTHGLWLRQFGADPGAPGKTLTLDGRRYTVVGVLPASFRFHQNAEVFISFGSVIEPYNLIHRANHSEMLVLARLRPGVTLDEARTQMNTIARRLEQQYPDTNTGVRARLTPLRDQVAGGAHHAIFILLGAVGFVLLIACVNVANLLLARAAGREKEVAIRVALGGGRVRVLRLLLTESVLVALAGGALGLLLAFWSFGGLTILIPQVTKAGGISVDYRVLGFTLLVSLLAGALFGLVPALRTSRPDLHEALKEGGRTSAVGSGHRRWRDGLVVAEVALAVVLLASAVLLTRSLFRILEVKPGFNPQRVVTMRVSLPLSKYPAQIPAQMSAYYLNLVRRVQTLPTVQSAGAATGLPFSGDFLATVLYPEDQAVPPRADFLSAVYHVASPDYFRAMGIPLLRGKLFSESDPKVTIPQRITSWDKLPRSGLVVIINDAMAQRFWPNEDPIGKRLRLGWPENNGPSITVVGIVGNTKLSGLDSGEEPEFFFSLLQWPPFTDMTVVARASSNPRALASALRGELRACDKDSPLLGVRTMEQLMSDSVSGRRTNMLLLGTFAALAVVLAAVGIYGVVSYSVEQRTHEIGVRMALGARRSDVLWLVVGREMALTLLGVAIGTAGAFGLTRFLASLLYGVQSTDPATFVTVPVLMVGVALLACYLPARRATKVDPLVALRYE